MTFNPPELKQLEALTQLGVTSNYYLAKAVECISEYSRVSTNVSDLKLARWYLDYLILDLEGKR